ncbi:TPR repeat-containing protein ZIP4 [Macadamia integrifolia]|uniref:TPR repeat-containing protein ZIP4 n=1 Tax=Macadamia integrifolia TaxID=60698 RepID=UPI001C4EE0D4|nr:TPR repeat-containing protein ZIP4 [Macadamia integrifolia]
MKILEISPELRPSLPGSCSQILEEIEASVTESERLSPENSSALDKLCFNIQKSLSRLKSVSPLSESEKLQIWKLSYRLWNSCVDLSNATGVRSSSKGANIDEQQAKLRQISADLLFLAGDVAGIPSPSLKSASFFYKTGLVWHDLKKFDLAASCFERATDLTAKVDVGEISDTGEQKLLLDLNLARSRTAWEVSERNLAFTLLNRSKILLFGSPESYRTLANQYLLFGKLMLTKNLESAIKDALKLMNEALDLCEKGLRIVRRSDESLPLKTLRSKSLRFIAAAHLQGREFESVLKCIKVLREGSGDQHPASLVLAMKAWLGLGRHREAEKELRGMVVNKEIPEGIWLSAIEAYFHSAGVAGAETVKGVFLGLLGRCHISAGVAVGVVHKLLGSSAAGGGGGGGGRDGSLVKAKVVAELVSDDRVMALFNSEEVAKERTTMHALLWNCGANHFRSKNFETSSEMFEKSMLYIPYNIEGRILRAKGFRVLCLCHLGLSLLDQAQEFIDEAENLEPNVTCAFLKFKVYLQKKDENGAIKQMQSMPTCHDFTPEFLTLSAHEAVACQALPVAVESLTNLLNFYSPGKPMPTPEVVVLRTLITILSREPTNENEILKFTKQAKKRMSELGSEVFFGKGEVARREKNWFAVNSWNIGTRTGREKKYELCIEFFELAAEFYGASIDGIVEESTMVCRSLILSVSATIAAEKSSNSQLPESDVKRAVQLLDRAGKILTEISSGLQKVDDGTAIEPGIFFIYTFNAYDLWGRLENGGTQQLQLVKSFASSKACTPEYLLQIGLNASQSTRTNPEVANFALNACLSSLLASPSPDYKSIALIIRKLIMLAGFYKGDTDDEVYSAYKQAYRIMVGLKEGEYPTEEGKWLATTAWNRAAMPVRLGQIAVARRWIKIGLELGRHVQGMEGYWKCLEEFVAGFDEKFNGHFEKDVGDDNISSTAELVL